MKELIDSEGFMALAAEAGDIARHLRPGLEAAGGKPVLVWMNADDLATIIEVLEQCELAGGHTALAMKVIDQNAGGVQ